MQKLREVEEARALMTEAASWSVVKWLREKKRVRQTADRANGALDRVSQSIKDSWGDELKVAYRELLQPAPAAVNEPSRGAPVKPLSSLDGQATLFVKKVKEADDEAYRARMDAENTFDEAERLLSTSLAREGCKKAIHSWDLHEKAIRKAQI
jgi:hypothetical protein